MEPRLSYFKVAPDLMQSVLALSNNVDSSGLDRRLLHLVKLRASQINGCSYCVDLHSREARHDGETEQRVHLVAAWRESPVFTARERAALAWTEKLTRLADRPIEDEDFEDVRQHFDDAELVKLTVAIGLINTWNRLAVPFRTVHPAVPEDRSSRK
ncbi:MAG TPA: carboxymuconolactone decarboxylase family protein [Microvirga sp.]|nr:carboxymuconolactone decarboxylase family protein [Microvirga sp.]